MQEFSAKDTTPGASTKSYPEPGKHSGSIKS